MKSKLKLELTPFEYKEHVVNFVMILKIYLIDKTAKLRSQSIGRKYVV